MIAVTKNPMTYDGKLKLNDKLNELKSRLPDVIEAIHEARKNGDLKENADFQESIREKELIDRQMSAIQMKLQSADVIDISTLKNEGKVIFGSSIEIVNVETEKKLNFKIVGEDEVDVKMGKLSYSSPVAKAAIGKYIGDTFEVITPQGQDEDEIMSVSYN